MKRIRANMKMKLNYRLIALEVLLGTGILTLMYGGYSLLLLLKGFTDLLSQGVEFGAVLASNVAYIFSVISTIGSGLAQLIASWLLGETFGSQTTKSKSD